MPDIPFSGKVLIFPFLSKVIKNISHKYIWEIHTKECHCFQFPQYDNGYSAIYHKDCQHKKHYNQQPYLCDNTSVGALSGKRQPHGMLVGGKFQASVENNWILSKKA